MISIDLEKGLVKIDGERSAVYRLGTPEAFALISKIWLRAGWDNKYVYSFTWMGRPIIQLPEDMVRLQEVIYEVKPDVIIETGIAHGGSLVFYASLCKAMEKGRVVGIDIEIRPHNREAIVNRGLAHAQKGNHDQALADFTEGLRLNPRDESLYADVAMPPTIRR